MSFCVAVGVSYSPSLSLCHIHTSFTIQRNNHTHIVNVSLDLGKTIIKYGGILILQILSGAVD